MKKIASYRFLTTFGELEQRGGCEKKNVDKKIDM
jgi:hypothetical protein